MKEKLIACSLFLVAMAAVFAFTPKPAVAQTARLTQTAAGPNCQVTGCINAPLSDGELFTWSDTLRYYGSYPINGRLAFRGLNYYLSGHSSGYQMIDLDSTAYENNGFVIHENFTPCYRCFKWHDGYLQLDNEYIGSDPFLYGWNGAVNVASGTGQIGLITAQPGPLVVTLASSNTNLLQVPSEVTILAGSLDANFTITATAPSGTAVTSVTVTATYPDSTVATMTLTVGSVPGQPPPDSKLVYPCGSKRVPCFGK